MVRDTTTTAPSTTTQWTYGATVLGTASLTGGPHAPTLLKTGVGAAAPTVSNGYSYDGAGRLTGKTTPAGAAQTGYTWNALGQLATAGATSFAYGPDENGSVNAT